MTQIKAKAWRIETVLGKESRGTVLNLVSTEAKTIRISPLQPLKLSLPPYVTQTTLQSPSLDRNSSVVGHLTRLVRIKFQRNAHTRGG